MSAAEILRDDGAGQQIVRSVSVDNLVNQRAAVLQMIGQAIALLRQAGQLADVANVGFPRLKIDEHRYDTGSILTSRSADLEASLQKIVDRGAWQYLMHESGLRTFMDAKARARWDESIEKGEFPPLTAQTVEATFRDLHEARADMFERGVIECFRRLSWHYKTNLPQKFGRRIVCTYLRSSIKPARGSAGTSLGHVHHHHCDELDDLVRVFCVLDGKPEPDHRSGIWRLLAAVNHTTDPDAENDYLRIRCFRNGNGHVTFKRPDLVAQLNRILAKHFPNALPEPKL